MAIRVGDQIVKGIFTGDADGNSVELTNIRIGEDIAQEYTFTLSFSDSVSNGSFSTTQVTYKGYVGETFSGSRNSSANSGFTLSSTSTSASGTNASAVNTGASSGVTSSWTVTMPQGGGVATITASGSASANLPLFTCSNAGFSMSDGVTGQSSTSYASASSGSVASVSPTTIQAGNSNSYYASINVPSSGYSNSGGSISGCGPRTADGDSIVVPDDSVAWNAGNESIVYTTTTGDNTINVTGNPSWLTITTQIPSTNFVSLGVNYADYDETSCTTRTATLTATKGADTDTFVVSQTARPGDVSGTSTDNIINVPQAGETYNLLGLTSSGCGTFRAYSNTAQAVRADGVAQVDWLTCNTTPSGTIVIAENNSGGYRNAYCVWEKYGDNGVSQDSIIRRIFQIG